jgi:hypothetical protein
VSARPRRQGSASFTIVIGGMAAVLVGAFMLTFVMYPYYNAVTGSAIWTADTSVGAGLLFYVGALWEFTGGIIIISILSWLWIRTRQ